jgi:protein-L-isoaspartate(D-aspartate) O-methyltransferase
MAWPDKPPAAQPLVGPMTHTGKARSSPEGVDPKALCAVLVETLRSNGCLRSPAIAAAFAAVPRHVFVPHVSVEEAYRNRWIATKSLPDGEVVSSSSQPEIMAVMLEQLDVRAGQRVLEIGAGTGYNAALLAHLVGAAGRVTTMDIDGDIVAAARTHLDAAGVTGVRVVCADGWAGDAEDGPYDRIVLTVGSHDISPTWRAQLAPGGRMLLPLSLPAVQACIAFDNRDGWLESVSVRGCIFMRLRGPAALPMRRVAVGPEPAPIVWPRGTHEVDGAAVHTLVHAPGVDLATGLVVPENHLHDGLVAWLGLHEPTSAWLTAHGKAVASGLVPPFFCGGNEWVSTFGIFESDGVALFIRAAATPDAADGGVSIGIRAHGNPDVGERLRAAMLGWVEAGRPSLAGLRVRAYPIQYPYHPRAREIVLTRPYTRLVLDWAP